MAPIALSHEPMSADFPYPIQRSAFPHNGLAHVVHGKGAPLVLIHGSLCDMRYWKAQIPALSRDFQVFSVSLRGYWPDDAIASPQGFSAQAHADDIAAFIDAHCGGRAHVAGHSRGGNVAFQVARRHPEKVAALVLADPGLMMNDGEDRRGDFRHKALRAIQSGDVEAGLALFIDTVSGEDTWRRMVPWFKQMVMDNAHTLAAQVAEPAYRLTENDARAVAHPVLLIGGALSPAPYPAILDALHAWLPNAQQLRIAGSSHGMNLGNPRAFNEAVRRFLGG